MQSAYIPAESENFEDEVKQMILEIAKGNPLLGVEMKLDSPAKRKSGGSPIKKHVKKTKIDKKSENAFLLSMAQRGKK